MKRLPASFCLVLFAVILLAAGDAKIPNMPAAVSSNAVAALKGGTQLFSMMGMGPRKTWDDSTNQVYILHLASGKWSEGRPVPGVVGRLGAVAIGVKNQIFLFGGYVVDGQGGELSVPDVNVYEPDGKRWYSGAEIPVPVDRAVIGVNRDRYIYLVGGRSSSGPVNNVQVYDIEKNTWSQATALPGPAVFGHAGSLVDETIVYVDGAMKNPNSGPKYVASEECWMGKIDRKDPNKIEWSKLPAHPGAARFGISAGASDRDRKIFFSGGSASPHNFRGMGYDGKPAEVSAVTFAYDVHGRRWDTISEDTFDPRMDTPSILATPLGEIVLGGMAKNQGVTSRVGVLPGR
jgi:N-acetylneuraminic acid mutarotase